MACSAPERDPAEGPSGEAQEGQALLEASLTLHASFDHGFKADFALGDPQIYSAPSWDEAHDAEVGLTNPDIQIVSDHGRFGSALQFTRQNTSAIFYRAEEKVSYSENDLSGTVSFWLSLSPDLDLAPGYCDPIQITDQAYNDGAVWVDFTNTDPRQFRLGVFGDLDSWNPEGVSSDENPRFEESLVVVESPPFRREEWTHVVITFEGLNADHVGKARLFLDGDLQGTIQDIGEPFSWDLPRVQVRIGVNYIGSFDDLALFDRALTEAEVSLLHGLERGVASLHR